MSNHQLGENPTKDKTPGKNTTNRLARPGLRPRTNAPLTNIKLIKTNDMKNNKEIAFTPATGLRFNNGYGIPGSYILLK
jgi:hypothetical protein